MLTARMIDAFRAVILKGSISDAAAYLNVSQPAVSRLIQDLEKSIGYNLFERRRGRIAATHEALELYEEVRRHFVGLNRIEQIAERIGKRENTTLRIACLPAIGLSVMPTVFARFRTRFPHVNLSLQINRSTTVMQLLNARQCDIGFVEAAYHAPDLHDGPSYAHDLVCVLPAGHRLAVRDEIRPEDLDGEPFVSFDRDTQTRIKTDSLFKSHGVTPEQMIEVPHAHSAGSLVVAGCGVTLIDPTTADTLIPQGIVIRPFVPATTFDFRSYAVPRLKDTELVTEFFEEFANTI